MRFNASSFTYKSSNTNEILVEFDPTDKYKYTIFYFEYYIKNNQKYGGFDRPRGILGLKL